VKAVLCISAHWETARPAIGASVRPGTIHDFYGFPPELYAIRYPAPGAPEQAKRAASLLGSAGYPCDVDRNRGLDHGAWVPLTVMYPGADMPVLQLSIQHSLDPAEHFAVGRAIEPMRHEGVLIVGSGGAVHPLGYPGFGLSDVTDSWALEFDEWLTDAVTRGDRERLIDYRKVAPYPERAHPRPDHYMPLLSALGAAGPGARGKVLHRSWYMGDLGLGAYEFDNHS
jgi:4,5-DOPA dioxygenase extradiol